METLRKPFLRIPRGEFGDLYILGGETLGTANIVDDLTGSLENVFDELVVIDTPEEVMQTYIPAAATVLSLLNLEGPE